MMVLYKRIEQSAKAADTTYRKAAGISEEALQEIKTVESLNGQKHETNKYLESFSPSQRYLETTGLKLRFS
jgi:hypothetical protein